MRRVVLIGLLIAAVALSSAAGGLAASGRVAAESDLELVKGAGRAMITMRGAMIGSIERGRIEIRELPGSTNPDIQVLGDQRPFRVNATTTIYRGENLRFRVFRGFWRVDIRGTGIFVSAAGYGSVRLQGEQGEYSVGGGPFRSWPNEWTRIPVGSRP